MAFSWILKIFVFFSLQTFVVQIGKYPFTDLSIVCVILCVWELFNEKWMQQKCLEASNPFEWFAWVYICKWIGSWKIGVAIKCESLHVNENQRKKNTLIISIYMRYDSHVLRLKTSFRLVKFDGEK